MKFLKEVYGNLKFTWRYVKDQKFRLLGYSICNIFAIAISIIAPIISAKIPARSAYLPQKARCIPPRSRTFPWASSVTRV